MAILHQNSAIKNTRGPRSVKLDDTALFQMAVSVQGLTRGWHRTRDNGGAAGGDNVTIDMFACDAAGWIGRLRRSLLSGEYQPGRLRHVDIPKKQGGVRTLAIPCVADRVVQSAVAQVLTPLLDAEFEPDSFAYRPGRSVGQAAARVSLAYRHGFEWIVDADIADFFDSVSHDLLMDRWAQSFTPGPLGDLIHMWMTYSSVNGVGLAQGSPISPLLANLFLDRLDEQFAQGRYRFVRFADDFVILAKSRGDADQAMGELQAWLARHGLRLNTEKTRIIPFSRGLKFLGHLFVNSLVTQQSHEDGAPDMMAFMRRLAREDAAVQAKSEAAEAEVQNARKAGYAPGFRVLYITEAGRRLHIRNRAFVVEEMVDDIQRGGVDGETWQEIFAVHHNRVDRVDVGPKATATEQALALALATDTPIVYVNGHGETLGWTATDLAPRAGRHMAQAEYALDKNKRVGLAQRIVIARLRTQRAVLRRLSRNKELDKVKAAISGLNGLIGRGPNNRIMRTETIDTLMGYEGQAAALWWRAISALMPPAFRFSRRQRGAEVTHAANAMLNFLAGLLHRDVAVAVRRADLHPGFGVLHTARDYSDACVYDVMEGFRAHLIGGLAVYCANKAIINPGDFIPMPDGGIRIKTSAAGFN